MNFKGKKKFANVVSKPTRDSSVVNDPYNSQEDLALDLTDFQLSLISKEELLSHPSHCKTAHMSIIDNFDDFQEYQTEPIQPEPKSIPKLLLFTVTTGLLTCGLFFILKRKQKFLHFS